MRARMGKMFRLPENVREELRQRLLDSARGEDLPSCAKSDLLGASSSKDHGGRR